uniref:Ig-like domain-containing protein n=1 Tax=Acrobeloides nanus TaxID=290746 RepID=A0A914DNL5_9BILA
MNRLPFILLLITWISIVYSQRITTQPRVFHVKVGDTVELPCYAEKVDFSEAVVMWKRGGDVLFADDDGITDDNRFEFHREGSNFTLIINKVEPYDTAEYICSITTTPELTLIHKVQVNVPPILKVVPDSPLFARKGEEVIAKCSASGNPPPTVKWRRRGGKIPRGSETTGNGRLRITSADIADSGFYECVGTNGVGGEVVALLEIRIESAPWVETNRFYIPTSTGADVNLTCRYNGEPSPATDWLYNAFKIN